MKNFNIEVVNGKLFYCAVLSNGKYCSFNYSQCSFLDFKYSQNKVKITILLIVQSIYL